MILYIVENGELVQYERKGECNRCGQCCCQNEIVVKGIAQVGNFGESDDDYAKWEGWSTFRDQGMDQWWKFEVTDKLRERPCLSHCDGECLCYDERPAACRYFPVHPRDVERFECGYWFERIDNADLD